VIRCQPSVAKPSRLEQQPFGLSFAFRLGRGMEWNILPANSWRPRRIHSGEVIGCWSRRCLTSGSLLSHPSIHQAYALHRQPTPRCRPRAASPPELPERDGNMRLAAVSVPCATARASIHSIRFVPALPNLPYPCSKLYRSLAVRYMHCLKFWWSEKN
jgi:hypothetical protein